MTVLPERYPEADWHPVPNFGYGSVSQMSAVAFVGHSAVMDGPPPRRFYDGQSASSHFWCFKDGTLWQLVSLRQPAWANGLLNRQDGSQSEYSIVRNWYANNINPNRETVSCELEGGAIGSEKEAMTGAQFNTLARLIRWLRENGLRLEAGRNFLPHNAISATACPSGRWPFAALVRSSLDTPSPRPEVGDIRLREVLGHRFDLIGIASRRDAGDVENLWRLAREHGILGNSD